MSRIFLPIDDPEEWQRFLAAPERQWRDGYSAKSLAYRWHAAVDFPSEIARLFATSSNPAFQQVELLYAFPEYKVALPGGGRASQCDLFVVGKAADGNLIAITVEGKVDEPFGPLVVDWMVDASSGKQRRLAFIADRLGVDIASLHPIRYQLLHRTVAAVLEAERLNAPYAFSLVHSFSSADKWFGDYEAFVGLFGQTAAIGQLIPLIEVAGLSVFTGWATGNQQLNASV